MVAPSPAPCSSITSRFAPSIGRSSGPGWVEIDLVSHSGNSGEGEFIYSLNITDIFTGWVETYAVLGKGQRGIVAALDALAQRLPFALEGIDSDNGKEFINAGLLACCRKHHLQFTRGRPYKKDDNAHIEQKNWTHVRKLLGWNRYDRAGALRAINALYAKELRFMMNWYQPSVKLDRKERVGSQVRRRYLAPQAPVDRLPHSKAVHLLKELRQDLIRSSYRGALTVNWKRSGRWRMTITVRNRSEGSQTWVTFSDDATIPAWVTFLDGLTGGE